MAYYNTNRKRPGSVSNDFNTAKRHQSSYTTSHDEALFVSDGEEDTQLDEELFGRDSESESFATLVRSLQPGSSRPQAATKPQPPSQSQSQIRPSQNQSQTTPNAQSSTLINGTANNRPPVHSSSGPTRSNSTTTRVQPSTSTSTSTTKPATNSTTNNPTNRTPSPPPSPFASHPIEIKDEQEDSTPPRVKLYIGKRNKTVFVDRSDLQTSPVLQSYVVDDAELGEAYIMRPRLLRTDVGDFDAVLQYLAAGEYAPLLVEDTLSQTHGFAFGDGCGHGQAAAAGVTGTRTQTETEMENAETAQDLHTRVPAPNFLDGLTTNEQYAKELVRSGRIYKLAQTFQVQGMSELVYKKITTVDAKKFSIRSLVELAGVIFGGRKGASGGGLTAAATHAGAAGVTSIVDGNGTISVGTSAHTSNPMLNDNEDTTTTTYPHTSIGYSSVSTASTATDKLESWIIHKLAENFREIMTREQPAFWQVERRTREKLLLARVLEEVAGRYRGAGGRLVGGIVEID